MTQDAIKKPCKVLCILLAEFSLNLPAHIRSDEDAEKWMQEHASNELEWIRHVAEEIKVVALADREKERQRLAEIDKALGDLLQWFNSDGSPCDGFKLRETVLHSRQIFNKSNNKEALCQNG